MQPRMVVYQLIDYENEKYLLDQLRIFRKCTSHVLKLKCIPKMQIME